VGPGSIHAAQRFQRLVGAKAPRVADHHLGQAYDGVEWRAQLVAHAGEELRLILARQFQLAVLVLDFVEQPHVLDCDHRQVGECLHECDLFVSERLEFQPVEADASGNIRFRAAIFAFGGSCGRSRTS
jgi:hypothetical protein